MIGLGLSDKAIFSETLKAMAHLKNPFYAFVVTLSSHHPFDFEGMDDGSLALPPELKGTLVGNYLLSIHYFDREFGRFVDGLRREKLLDKSLIVVYGDHPAIPAEYREQMGKLLGIKTGSPMDWKKTGRIPLMFRIPGKKRITGISDIDTGQMDILPTVAGLMGLEIQTVFGKDLFAENPNEPVVFRNGSYVINGIFVEPALGRATRIHTNEKLDAGDFGKFSEDARQRLHYSDHGPLIMPTHQPHQPTRRHAGVAPNCQGSSPPCIHLDRHQGCRVNLGGQSGLPRNQTLGFGFCNCRAVALVLNPPASCSLPTMRWISSFPGNRSGGNPTQGIPPGKEAPARLADLYSFASNVPNTRG